MIKVILCEGYEEDWHGPVPIVAFLNHEQISGWCHDSLWEVIGNLTNVVLKERYMGRKTNGAITIRKFIDD